MFAFNDGWHFDDLPTGIIKKPCSFPDTRLAFYERVKRNHSTAAPIKMLPSDMLRHIAIKTNGDLSYDVLDAVTQSLAKIELKMDEFRQNTLTSPTNDPYEYPRRDGTKESRLQQRRDHRLASFAARDLWSEWNNEMTTVTRVVPGAQVDDLLQLLNNDLWHSAFDQQEFTYRILKTQHKAQENVAKPHLKDRIIDGSRPLTTTFQEIWAKQQAERVTLALLALKMMTCVSKTFQAECKAVQIQIVRTAKECTIKSFTDILPKIKQMCCDLDMTNPRNDGNATDMDLVREWYGNYAYLDEIPLELTTWEVRGCQQATDLYNMHMRAGAMKRGPVNEELATVCFKMALLVAHTGRVYDLFDPPLQEIDRMSMATGDKLRERLLPRKLRRDRMRLPQDDKGHLFYMILQKLHFVFQDNEVVPTVSRAINSVRRWRESRAMSAGYAGV